MKYLSNLCLTFLQLFIVALVFLTGIKNICASNWNESLGSAKGFIENKGQFNVKT